VNDMRSMFSNCRRLTSLNLYNFDMSGLTSHTSEITTYSGKHQMCYNLASISGACAITCPTAIQTELQSGTSLVNSRITWYTH
jgi:surface protein